MTNVPNILYTLSSEVLIMIYFGVLNVLMFSVLCLSILLHWFLTLCVCIYRVIQEELPPLMELISVDILSKKCHINLGPILNIYRVTFVIRIIHHISLMMKHAFEFTRKKLSGDSTSKSVKLH
jgi:tellurite resistance protein TehA-like permease